MVKSTAKGSSSTKGKPMKSTSHSKPTTATSFSPQAKISSGSSTPQQSSGLLAQAGEQKRVGSELNFSPAQSSRSGRSGPPPVGRTDQGLGVRESQSTSFTDRCSGIPMTDSEFSLTSVASVKKTKQKRSVSSSDDSSATLKVKKKKKEQDMVSPSAFMKAFGSRGSSRRSF